MAMLDPNILGESTNTINKTQKLVRLEINVEDTVLTFMCHHHKYENIKVARHRADP
jgi:hypothetical protein